MRNKKQLVLALLPTYRQIEVPDSPLIHIGLLEAPRLAGFAFEKLEIFKHFLTVAVNSEENATHLHNDV